MTFKEQIELYLKDLPAKWKDQLVAILCLINDQKQQPSCPEVKECETLTSLSNFSVSGTTISIVYKDEHNTEVTRSFDISDIINSTLDDIDPDCLTSPTAWASMTYIQRIQALITAHCNCCTLQCITAFTPNAITYHSCIADPGTGGLVVFNFTLVDQNANLVVPDVGTMEIFSNSLGGTFFYSGTGSAFTYTVGVDTPLADLQNNTPVITFLLNGIKIFLPLVLINLDTDCE